MTEAAPSNQWRRCSACKKPLAFGSQYWVCNVSTCNKKRTGLAFCTVSCWEVHLPVANHREAWAEERTAPRTKAEADAAESKGGGGARRIVRDKVPSPRKNQIPEEVLVVASRLKEYVKARSGMNCSDRVLIPLSEIIRRAADEAIRNAEKDERKTILDRDIPLD
jgi:histone H3/H4